MEQLCLNEINHQVNGNGLVKQELDHHESHSHGFETGNKHSAR